MMRRLLRSLSVEKFACSPTAAAVSTQIKTVAFSLLLVLWSAGSAFAQTNCIPAVDVVCPPSVTVGCEDIDNLDITGNPTYSVEFCITEAVVDYIANVDYTDVTVPGNACSHTVIRTWVVSVGDLSGSCSQTIVVMDNQGPVFDVLPENSTVQCYTDYPAPMTLTASDACGEVVSIQNLSVTGNPVMNCALTTPMGPGPDGSIWLNLNNNNTMEGFELWSWTGSPSLVTYNDGSAHLVGDVLNNANAASGWHVDMWFANKRDWAAWSALGRSYKDDLGYGLANHTSWDYYELTAGFSTLTGYGANAGNSLSLSHQPSNYYFGFQSGVGANNRNGNDGMSGWFYWSGWMNGQQMNGNGDMFTEKSCGPINLQDDCVDLTVVALSRTYVYRAVDACGNATVATQVITFEDTTAPVLSGCPENVTISCADEMPAPANVTATDNCVYLVPVSVSMVETESENSTPCTRIIVRTWSAFDCYNNRAQCSQTITIVDDVAPVFTYVPADASYECDEQFVTEMATAADACDHGAAVTVNEWTSEGDCPQSYVLHRDFTATDDCGNASYASQVITVVDTTAPVFAQENTYTSAECTDVNNVPAPTATDNCGEVTIEMIDESLNSGGCLGVLQRTYRATDECGNSSLAYVYISVLDTTAPVIYGPEDMVAECSEVPSAPEVETFDNCGYEVTVTFEETITPGDCENSYTIEWHWHAVDYCDNFSDYYATVTVQDTTNPWLVGVPENVVVECSDDVPAVVTVTGMDNCDDSVEVTVTEQEIAGDCPNSYSIMRIYRAQDNCGNYAIAVQYIYVVDTTAPVMEGEAQIVVECDQDVPYMEPSASDNCSDVTVTYADSTMFESSCYTQIVRTFTATDACGNYSTFAQYISVVDTTAPVVTAEVEITRPCDDYSGMYIQYADNCQSEVFVDYSDEHVSGGCQGRIIRTYYLSDACENSTEFMQIITLTDEIAPVVETQTPDFTVECNTEYATPSVTFTDNCDDEVATSMEVMTEGDDCTQYVSYVFTATDNCGNMASATVVVTITDMTAPMLYVSEGGEFSCDQTIEFGSASATDNCDDNVEISYVDFQYDGDCPQSYVIERQYTATDNCGNQDVASSFYYVYDLVAPEFTSTPADMVVECNTEIPASSATAVDNCGEVSVTMVEETIESSACYTLISRVFTAADQCGNSSTYTQAIEVVDTTAPVFAGEIEITRPCGDYAGIYVQYSDNCQAELSVDYSDEHVSGGCQGRIIRTYYVSDGCDNSAEFMQIITLTDEVAPVASFEPADATYECTEEWGVENVTFTDNCDDEVATTSEVVESGDACVHVYTYTWTGTDNCGNVTTVDQVITVVDTTAPSIWAPQGGEFSCDEDIMYGQPEAMDACNEFEVTYSDSTIAGECAYSYTIVRTWTATDACGNAASASSMYYVNDTTAPEFTSTPEALTVECNTEIPTSTATAEDNCGMVTVSTSDLYDYYTEGCTTVKYRVFTATDECGNSAEYVQYITIVDTTAPVITAEAEMTLPCDNYEGVFASATDNCQENVTITHSDEHVSGGCQGRIIRTYVAEDGCGNSSEFMQIITLTDVTAPVSETGSQEVTVECGDQYPAFDPMWSDNCDDELALTAISGISQDGCTQIISQVYTAVDNCGNSASVTYTVYIVDTTAPIIEGPQGGEYSCDQEFSFGQAAAIDVCDDQVEITFSDSTIAGECPNSYTIVRTWVATDDCGNSSSVSAFYYIYDNSAPTFDSMPENESYECYPSDYQPQVLTASDNCGTASVQVSMNDDVNECGNGVIIVTYVATDLCGNTSSTGYVVTINDTTDPVLSSMPSDIVLGCSDEIPAAEVVTASDNCDQNVTVTYNEVIYNNNQLPEGAVSACDATTPDITNAGNCQANYNNTNWALWLGSMPVPHRYFSLASGQLYTMANGDLHLVATFVNTQNPTWGGFTCDVTFNNGMDWATWDSQPWLNSFKADCGGVGANHTAWMYYLLQNNPGAELVGFGAYANSNLNLSHAPANKYYAFQLGDGANNLTSDYGFGGWFTYSGTFLVNNEQVFSGQGASGAGDFAIDLNCCPDITVWRCWSATDCSGNMVEHCQTITYEGSSNTGVVNTPTQTVAPSVATATASKGDLEITTIFPNPASAQTEVRFVSNTDTKVALDIIDMTGRKVAQLYTGDVAAGLLYRFNVNTDNFGNGLYQVRLMNDKEVATKQLNIAK